MAKGRSTKIISMINWIRTSRLLIKNSLSLSSPGGAYHRRLHQGAGFGRLVEEERQIPVWHLGQGLSVWGVGVGDERGRVRKKLISPDIASHIRSDIGSEIGYGVRTDFDHDI